jgi:hypothetical protein
MGRYLDLIAATRARETQNEVRGYEKNEVIRFTSFNSFISYRLQGSDAPPACAQCHAGGEPLWPLHTRVSSPERLNRVLDVLDGRRPDHVEHDRWRRAVEDGRRFLAAWGAQAQALGWTARDLFGLFPVPEKPHPTFSRLSRYEHTGLIWLLHGCPVIALTEATAAIQNPSGAITIYRKHNEPVLGPAGDSLDDLE